MKIRDYQTKAASTHQVPGTERDDRALMVPLLGLAGETGTLLTEYKKWLREGSAYQIFKERIAEDLGDILWYVANIASKEGLDLEAIARENLKKLQSRWLPSDEGESCFLRQFDEQFPPKEQFPRTFRIEIAEVKAGTATKVQMTMNGKPLGDGLTDNAYDEDGYRYHDIFHLAYAAVLGWSPVIRKLMERKRRSDPKVDEVEDGGRAGAIEEGISALVFDYAKDHSFLENVDHVDYGILRTIKQLTRHVEVAERSEFQWEDAILKGFSVWRKFQHYRRGVIIGDLKQRTIEFEMLPAKRASQVAKSKSKVTPTRPRRRRSSPK
jgi:NTP pyrophosphatase (non-canonical NTP hydrolase)